MCRKEGKKAEDQKEPRNPRRLWKRHSISDRSGVSSFQKIRIGTALEDRAVLTGKLQYIYSFKRILLVV